MKKLITLVSILLLTTQAYAVDSHIRDACAKAFETAIVNKAYPTRVVTSVRMSSNHNIVAVPSKQARIQLFRISAYFYVKYRHNSGEVRELSRAGMLYDETRNICRTSTVGEFNDNVRDFHDQIRY